jgi:hypothetical protein
MGLAQYAILAQVHPVTLRIAQFAHGSQAIANVELLGINLTVARSANDGAGRYQKGTERS